MVMMSEKDMVSDEDASAAEVVNAAEIADAAADVSNADESVAPTVESPDVTAIAEESEPAVEVSDEPVNEFGFTADEMVSEDEVVVDDGDENASPIEEFVDEEAPVDTDVEMKWYILKVQVNREGSICAALTRRVKQAGFEHFFGDILVPTEDVREFNKSGKQKNRKAKALSRIRCSEDGNYR